MAKKLTATDVEKDHYPDFNLHDLRHDAKGFEHLDPTPMQPPIGYKRQPSLSEQVRAMVYQHKRELEDSEPESLEEADDFEIEDDYDPHSRWENDFEPSIKELKKLYAQRLEEEKKKKEEPPAAAPSATSLPPQEPSSAPGADPSPKRVSE